MDIFSLALHQPNTGAKTPWVMVAAVAERVSRDEETHQICITHWAGSDAIAVATDRRVIVAYADSGSLGAHTIEMPYEQIDRVSVGSLTAEIISDSGCLVLVARDENLMVLARLVNAALTGLVGESTRVLVR